MIETIIIIVIAIVIPLFTEWRLKRMIRKLLRDPKTAKEIAKLVKQILKEYRNA